MEYELVFKIATIGISVAMVNMVLSRLGRDEYNSLTTLAGVIIVLLLLLGEIGKLFDTIGTVFDLA